MTSSPLVAPTGWVERPGAGNPWRRQETFGRRVKATGLLVFLWAGWTITMAEERLVIDEPGIPGSGAGNGGAWQLVTDGVMGGVSSGTLTRETVAGRPCLRLRGDVRLENNGGFVQAALDLSGTPASDASEYAGVLLEVYGNGERYNLHLRTRDVRLPWQSYRASFEAPPRWQTLRLPFAQFSAHRIDAALDLRRLERAGIVAIGRKFTSDLCIASLALYR